MRRTRSFAFHLSLSLGMGAVLALALGLGGVLSCTKYPTYKDPPNDVPADCKAEDPYDYQPLDSFGTLSWWASADYAPCAAPQQTNIATSGGCQPNSAYAAVTAAVPIPDPGVCGSSTAGMFQATHNNDWGCVYGMWSFFNEPNTDKKGRDESEWQGLSFWARAPGNTSKAFTLILDDNNTYAVTPEDVRNKGVQKTNCRSYPTDGGTDGATGTGGESSSTTTVVTDPGTGTPITGSSNTRAAYPDECGNGYYVVVEVTSDWHLYTIPWGAFKQGATPNRVPNTALFGPDAGPVDNGSMLLTSALRNLTLRAPKEAELELWMTKLAFYRRKAQ